ARLRRRVDQGPSRGRDRAHSLVQGPRGAGRDADRTGEAVMQRTRALASRGASRAKSAQSTPSTAVARRRAPRSERGTALIETALVATLLISLVVATFELGMAWRSASTNANAARAGARVASSQGVDRLADHATILAVASGLSSTGN